LHQQYLTCLKVEKTILKVHQSFLEKYSPATQDLSGVARQTGGIGQANDENPLALMGDGAVG
jgi:hypothetical protein